MQPSVVGVLNAVMSLKRKGQLAKPPERIRHLGHFLSRLFWKRERQAEKTHIAQNIVNTTKDLAELKERFTQLVIVLIAISSTPEKQKQLLGVTETVVDMMDDYAIYYTNLRKEYLTAGLISNASVGQLDELDARIDEMSAEKDEALLDQLEGNEDWEILRKLARLSLVALGKDKATVRVTRKIKREGDLILEFTQKELVE